MIEFQVIGEPHAKERARAVRRGNFISHYTPEKTVAYEKKVAQIAQIAMQSLRLEPSDKPIELSIFAVRSVPESWAKKKRALALSGEMLPTSKPDLDNIVKSIKDGCNGIAWKDDSQVVMLQAAKSYGERPHVRVLIKLFKA